MEVIDLVKPQAPIANTSRVISSCFGVQVLVYILVVNVAETSLPAGIHRQATYRTMIHGEGAHVIRVLVRVPLARYAAVVCRCVACVDVFDTDPIRIVVP
jgi:hypothetical protein